MKKYKESNRYVALDFETMDTWRATVCSLAVVIIEDNKIVDKFYSLVCPPSKNENPYCVMTHGLHYKDVENAPDFPTVWKKVDKMIKGCPIIAHNVGFEKSCINACNETFDTPNDYTYIDTLKLARKYLKSLTNHKLDTVCENLNIKLRHHHNAADDAKACGEIFIKLKKKFKLND